MNKPVIHRTENRGPKTFKEKEELIDKAVDLILMGFDKPYHLMKMLPVSNMNTAKRYLEAAEKRMAAIYERVGDRERALKKDLADLEMNEKRVWDEFEASKKKKFPMSINSVTQSIVKIKERRAKLLGLDITNLNLSGSVGLGVAEIARIVRETAEADAEAGKEQSDGGGTGTDAGAEDSEHIEGN